MLIGKSDRKGRKGMSESMDFGNEGAWRKTRLNMCNSGIVSK